MDRPQRSRPAHQPVFRLGNQSEIVFITVCVEGKRRLLDNASAHQLILDAWREADHWCVGRYMIMPNHIHLFAAPSRLDHLSVKRWIAFWKSRVTRHWPHAAEKPLWQRDGWDTQLRKGESYASKWEYVVNNPVRAGFVTSAEDWPFQGEIVPMVWHD